jgi:GntR family transcriptional regulator, transcriptional repressor for pyruvate dehydrogenase complex
MTSEAQQDPEALGPLEASETLTDRVTRKLIEYLVSLGSRPNQRLPSERQMANALGVGRSVIRDAVKTLSLLGLLESRQGAGTYLRSPEALDLTKVIEWGLLLGQKQVDDLIELRRSLEVISARLAAQRRTVEQVEALRDDLQAMERSQSDSSSFVSSDVAFHVTLARASGNALLASQLESIQSLLSEWIKRAIRQHGQTEETCVEHRRILDAVVDSDPDAAAAAMAAHMEAAYLRLSGALDAEKAAAQGLESPRRLPPTEAAPSEPDETR